MKRSLRKIGASFIGLFLIAIIVFTVLAVDSVSVAEKSDGDESSGGKIFVTNRASGTISVIDVRTDEVVATPPLPAGANPPEPMYVVYSNRCRRAFIGDRANNRVVVFNANDFSVEGTIAAGAGVFHMWADKSERQLWVNNDIDKTITVIDTENLSVITTIPTPADLVALGGKPHDVILDPTDSFAFVTINGVSGANDFVVKYSTETFAETGRAAVGKDPHVSLSRHNNFLYVPCQASNVLIVLSRETLAQTATLGIPGAHGAGMPRNGRRFYTTNLPGGGIHGLFAIDTNTNTVIGSTKTPYPTPHNIALIPNGKKLYVTHSGATADKITIYTVSNRMPIPTLAGEVTVGLNPFGLAFVP